MTVGDSPPASIRRNTLINLTGAVVPIAVAFVTIPLYLDRVGQARYALLVLAWLLLTYFGLLSLGLGRAAAHRIARLEPGSARCGQVFWTAATLGLALGVLGGIVLFGVGFVLLDEVVKMPPPLRAEAVGALPFLAGAVPFAMLLTVCVGALEGAERFLAVNLLEVLAIVLYQVAPLTLAFAVSSNVTLLIAAAAGAPVVSSLLGLAYCASRFGVRPRIDSSTASALFRFGRWITFSGLLLPLLMAVDRFVVGAVIGARAVAQYTIPFTLVTRLVVVPLSVSRTLFPRLSQLGGVEGRALSGKAVAAVAAVMTPLVVFGLVILEPFLRLWVGADVAAAAAPAGEILLAGVWVNSLAFVPLTLLQGRGRPDLPAKLQLVQLAPYLILLWLAVSAAGIEGAAWTFTARVAVEALALFVLAGIYDDLPLGLAAPLFLVAASYIAAQALFDEALWRGSLGGTLVVLALGWSWRTAPQALRRALVEHASRRRRGGRTGQPTRRPR